MRACEVLDDVGGRKEICYKGRCYLWRRVQMLVQRQDADREMKEKIQKLMDEKQSAVDTAATLQRTLAAIEADKRLAERSAIKLHKDKCTLKKTLDKVVYSNFDSVSSFGVCAFCQRRISSCS